MQADVPRTGTFRIAREVYNISVAGLKHSWEVEKPCRHQVESKLHFHSIQVQIPRPQLTSRWPSKYTHFSVAQFPYLESVGNNSPYLISLL